MPVRALGGSPRLRHRVRQNMAADYPDTAAVYRPGAPAPTDDFGHSSTFALLDLWPASFHSPTGREALVLQQMQVQASAVVSLPYDADVDERDQIVLTEGESGQVHHFEVVFVQDRSRPFGVHVMCIEYKFRDDS